MQENKGRHPHVANSEANLAKMLMDNGRATEAEPLLRDALSIYQDKDPQNPIVVKVRHWLIASLEAQGKPQEAASLRGQDGAAIAQAGL